jgi:hypothetical protein
VDIYFLSRNWADLHFTPAAMMGYSEDDDDDG